MSDSPTPPPAESVLAAARRRARGRRVRTALLVIVALMFLAGGAGFAWGMWEEVARDPGLYAALETDVSMPALTRWSVGAASRLARMQIERAARRRQSRRNADPTARSMCPSTNDRTPCGDADDAGTWRPPHPGAVNEREIEGPALVIDDPVHDPGDLTDPKHPNNQTPTTGNGNPAKDPVWPKRTDRLRQKAQDAYRLADKYLKKGGPSAPASGRDAALRNALQHLKRARDLYTELDKRTADPKAKRAISLRIMDINRCIFWANRHRGVRRR